MVAMQIDFDESLRLGYWVGGSYVLLTAPPNASGESRGRPAQSELYGRPAIGAERPILLFPARQLVYTRY